MPRVFGVPYGDDISNMSGLSFNLIEFERSTAVVNRVNSLMMEIGSG